jgi:hypothetical protein
LNIDKLMKEININTFDLMYISNRIQYNVNFVPTGGWGTEGYIVSQAGSRKIECIDIITNGVTQYPIDHVFQGHMKLMPPNIIREVQRRSIWLSAYRSKYPCVKHYPNGTSSIGRPEGSWLRINEK